MGLFGLRNQVVRLSLYARTDVGRARDHNEDNFMVADLTMRRPILTPEVREHLVGDKGSILVVADGMGGAAAGELASAMAAGIIYEQLRATWIESRRSDFRTFLTFVQQAIETANHEIHQRSLGEPGLSGMGTTLTAAGILGDRIGFAQIGDSRAYLMRQGQVEQVTRDQSLTRRLIDEGRITEAEAESSPGRNIILQALGPRPSVEVAVSERTACRGDILVALLRWPLRRRVRRGDPGGGEWEPSIPPCPARVSWSWPTPGEGPTTSPSSWPGWTGPA
jgi:PPM family protein phosphatase